METEHECESGRPDVGQEQQGGRPGDGKGRVDVTGHSGVYPVSAMDGASGEARLQGEASWGQGDRGAVGYEDHGDSELVTMPPETAAERAIVAGSDEAPRQH
jgi:hypothetical protein